MEGEGAVKDRALDLKGQRFGQLKPIAILERDQQGALWLCECSCGRFAKRYASALMSGRKARSNQTCAKCQEDAREVFFRRLGVVKKSRVLDLYREKGRLYSQRFEQEYRKSVLSELEMEFGERQDEEPDPAFSYEAMKMCVGSMSEKSASYEDCLREQIRAAFNIREIEK